MQDRRYKHWPMGVPRQFPLPETSLCYNLEVAATRYARKTAIYYYGGELAFAELKAQADALAGYLQQDCGVRRGDRVLLYMQNSPQFVVAYYAILRADAVVVPVNPMNLTAELTHYVSDAGAKLAICGHELLPRIVPLLAAQGLARIIYASYADYIDPATDLLASPNLRADSLKSLRGIAGGGAAMPEAVAKRLYELTGLEFCEGYGLTETAAPTHSNHPSRPKRQCLGIPLCNTDSRIIDADTLKELGPGETGEIIACGPQVFTGYWNNPDATRAVFIQHDGKRFFRTGDLGRYDEDGYFFIVDRLKRMIDASGFKVWPAEVEAMMYAHPDIQEACVIGALDPYRGETVKAVVVLKAASRGRVQAGDIIEWCKTHMAAYKYPRIIEFVDSLPKSATGKVMWRQLQEKESAKAKA